MKVVELISNSIAIALIILFLTVGLYALLSVYFVFAVYLFVVLYGLYKKYWDLILGVFWAFAVQVGLYLWVGDIVSQIN